MAGVGVLSHGRPMGRTPAGPSDRVCIPARPLGEGGPGHEQWDGIADRGSGSPLGGLRLTPFRPRTSADSPSLWQHAALRTYIADVGGPSKAMTSLARP